MQYPRSEVIHGRKSTAHLLPGSDELLVVLFTGEGPIPEYDISGWEGDVPIGEYAVQRTKISRDYRHYADALLTREKEGIKKNVTRPRGALYVLRDKETETWAVWLETWVDYFSRSHILKSPESVERDIARSHEQIDAEYAARLAQQKAELSRPTTWIAFTLALGLFVVAIIAWVVRSIGGN